MKRFPAILFLFVSFAAQSQANLTSYLATSAVEASAKEQAKEKLQAFIQSLSSSRLTDQRLLRKTFHQVHSTFLKKYDAYADFDQVFTSGHYDCLTATALFSQVLDQMKFSYEIVETNYHIFIVVKTSKGEVLLETTDRFGGFITDDEEIAKRTGDYRKNQLTAGESKNFIYQYSFKLYQNISTEKLTGLLYFNQSVKAYNRHDWIASSKLLEKANALYTSPRCEELGGLLIQTVLESKMEEKSKTDCLVHLKSFWIKKSEPIASN